jgi:uncharacterized protein YneF (UPF0154 family)
MNIIIYGLSLLIAYLAGFFVAIKAVHLGLRWQIQTAEKKEPELHSPIQPIVEAVQQKKADEINQYAKEQIQEWLFGESK